LLRFDEVTEAAKWLAELEDVADAKNSLAFVALKARVLQSQDKQDEIKTELDRFAAERMPELDDDEKKAELLLGVGKIFSTVGMYGDAENLYRQVIKTFPEQFGSLAASLAKQEGKAAEAIELCREVAKAEGAAYPAIVLASLVISSDIPEELFDQVEELFSQAIEESPENPVLLTAIANTQIVWRNSAKAIQLYKEILRIRPKDLIAMNNLATLLAEDSSARTEALDYINEALGIAGPQDVLLDTKAMILVQEGRADEAVPLLETACSHRATDPRYLFHLAVAYHRTDRKDDALKALQQAMDSDLEEQILTESDEEMYRQLRQEFQL
jgi:tetratricopeptide (TPR) repeat protein